MIVLFKMFIKFLVTLKALFYSINKNVLRQIFHPLKLECNKKDTKEKFAADKSELHSSGLSQNTT